MGASMVIDLGPKWLPEPPFGAKIDDQAGGKAGNRPKTGAPPAPAGGMTPRSTSTSSILSKLPLFRDHAWRSRVGIALKSINHRTLFNVMRRYYVEKRPVIDQLLIDGAERAHVAGVDQVVIDRWPPRRSAAGR